MNNLTNDIDARSASVTLADEIVFQEDDANVHQILSLYNRISREKDLRPCAAINTLFGELVGLCTQTLSQEVTRTASYFLTVSR